MEWCGMIKQVIVMRKDLNMRKGKMVAQGSHASMGAILREMTHTGNDHLERWELNTIVNSDIAKWLNGKFTKICVSVDSQCELEHIYELAEAADLPCSLIVDSGKTEFGGEATATAVAVGPGNSEDIDEITGHLKLL